MEFCFVYNSSSNLNVPMFLNHMMVYDNTGCLLYLLSMGV